MMFRLAFRPVGSSTERDSSNRETNDRKSNCQLSNDMHSDNLHANNQASNHQDSGHPNAQHSKGRYVIKQHLSKLSSNRYANQQGKWLHHGKELKESFVVFNAKYLGCVEVNQPKGVEVVRDAIKKLKIARQLKKSEAGHKGSKLVKVELVISIDSIKVLEMKNKNMICSRPLQRVSYCADDHKDKRLFAFIAKEQETKKHKCFVFVSEREASEITLTLGQAFQLAYKRYLASEKAEIKENKDAINIGKEIEKLKEENEKLKQELESNKSSSRPQPSLTAKLDNNTPTMQSTAELPLHTLPTDSFGFLSDPFSSIQTGNLNDSSCKTATSSGDELDLFNDSNTGASGANSSVSAYYSGNASFYEDFHVSAESDDDKIDDNNMFGKFDGSPREEDFYVRTDPFADTPDWRSAASEQSDIHPNLSNQFINDSGLSGIRNESPNPFISSAALVNSTEKRNEQSENVPYCEPNSDIFSQYLSNVVANRSSSECTHNSVNESSTNAQLNNDFSFNKLQLADTSWNSMSEFNETDDGFFADSNFVSRSKAYSTGSLFNKNSSANDGQLSRPNQALGYYKSNLTSSGNTLEEVDENEEKDFIPGNDIGPRPKSYSFNVMANNQTFPHTNQHQNKSHMNNQYTDIGNTNSELSESMDASFNESFNVRRPKAYSMTATTTSQIVRPRPSSFCVQSQILPAPPDKQSLKKPLPTPRPIQTTPVKEEHKNSSFEDKSLSHILPNVGRNQNVSVDIKSRSRASPLQPIRPLKESIARATKSLEDLCGIDMNSSIGSPRSDSGKRSNPFATGR